MFGNLDIESERSGFPKLRYDLCLDKKGLYFRYTSYGWSAFVEFFKKYPHLGDIPGCTLPREGESWGIDGAATTTKEGGFYAIRVPSHDKQKIVSAAKTISFMMMNEMAFVHESLAENIAIPNRQLFSFETGCSDQDRPHGWGMFLSLAPPVARLLESFPGQAIPNASEEMRRHWFSIQPPAKKEKTFLSDSFTAGIRQSGIPMFQTIGSCACMSVSPDQKYEGEGFSIDTHNVDAPIQQMNLLVGVACLWDFAKTELLKRAS